MVNLDNQRWLVFGMQGEGKTVLVRSILDSTKNHIVYDRTKHDYPGYVRYLPNDPQSATEMNDFVMDKIIRDPNRPRLFALDEANLFIQPKPSRLPTAIQELNDLGRHLRMSWGIVSRRPSQFHSDMTELAQHIFIFRLPGPKDHASLNQFFPKLGDRAATLPKFHFLHYDTISGTVTQHTPLTI